LVSNDIRNAFAFLISQFRVYLKRRHRSVAFELFLDGLELAVTKLERAGQEQASIPDVAQYFLSVSRGDVRDNSRMFQAAVVQLLVLSVRALARASVTGEQLARFERLVRRAYESKLQCPRRRTLLHLAAILAFTDDASLRYHCHVSVLRDRTQCA
jgi:hypothetical protein